MNSARTNGRGTRGTTGADDGSTPAAVMRRTLRVAPLVSTQGGGVAAKFEF